MSFGFGVGDFLDVIQLSKQIWDACKDSTDAYREIGKDVRQTNLILSAIEQYWKNEKENGHEIMMADQNNLKDMEEICHETLKKIQAILQKHRKLGTRGSTWDRVKWIAWGNDIAPLRASLQNSNYQMAFFNATLTATNASNRSEEQMKLLKELRDQGKILEVVMKQYQQMQEGTADKPPPAYSQMTVKDIEEDEDEKWSAIRADLKETGLNDGDLRSHMAFIKAWIETVSSSRNNGPKDPLEPLDESAEISSIDKPGQPSTTSHVGKDSIALANTSTLPFGVEAAASPPPPQHIYQRPSSASTHRSQASVWRDPSTEGNTFAVKMIAKVLKSKYGEDHDDLYVLPVKRAYHYLDYTNAGWLSREEVQNVCKAAASLAGVDFQDSEVATLVKSMDKDNNHAIDREELIEVVRKLRSRIFEVLSVSSQTAARVDAGIVLKAVFENSGDNHILPFGWSSSLDFVAYWKDSSTTKRLFTHEVTRPVQNIAPLQLNMASAAYTATQFCAKQIATVRALWRNALLNMKPEEALEYHSALENVSRAVTNFHFLDDDGTSAGWVLDECLEQMRFIPLELFDDLKDGPVENLILLQKQCWALLDPILGFVWNFKPSHQRLWSTSSVDQIHLDVSSSPPDLSEWRRRRMLEVSRLIDSAASGWTDMKTTILNCHEWISQNKVKLSGEVHQAIGEAKALHDAQEQVNSETSQREIVITSVRMENLAREGLRSRYPKIYYRVSVDGREYGCSNTEEDTASPQWVFSRILVDYGPILDLIYYRLTCTSKGKREDTVQLDFHRGVSSLHSFTTASKTLIGSYKFKIRDVTNFEQRTSEGLLKLPEVLKFAQLTSHLVTSIGLLDRVKHGFLNHSKQPKTKIVVEVRSTWESTTKWEASDGGLPSLILKRPIPDEWEVRRTKEDDVYFLNKTRNKPTACLWQDPTAKEKRPALPEPLPTGWRLAHHGAKLLYHRIDKSGYQTERPPPDVDETSVFEHVLKSREYCELHQFFSDAFLKSLEEQANPIPRYLRITTASA